jgi:hypothetical protein
MHIEIINQMIQSLLIDLRENWRTYTCISGLFIDIAGAFFLASSFLHKTTKDMEAESEAHYDTNPVLYKSLYKQVLEVYWGFGLLSFGFALQVISYCKNSSMLIYSLLCLILIFCCAYFIRLDINNRCHDHNESEIVKEPNQS